MCLMFAKTLLPFLLQALYKQNHLSDASINPSFICQWDVQFALKGGKDRGVVYMKERHEIRDGFTLTNAFEFFMWQIWNFCCSGPDLVLISAQLCSRACSLAWECQRHLFSHSQPSPIMVSFIYFCVFSLAQRGLSLLAIWMKCLIVV